ncbi:MAG: hypothetical protein ABWZ16_02815 [Microbacterium sp.]
MNSPLLEARTITKSHGRSSSRFTALVGVSLTVPASTAAATETGGSTAVLSPADLDAIAATDGILDVNPVIAVTPSWIEYDGTLRDRRPIPSHSVHRRGVHADRYTVSPWGSRAA